MLDEELRAQLADWVRPVAGLPVPDIGVLRRRARRRGTRRAATAAAITAAVAAAVIAAVIGVTASLPGRPGPGRPEAGSSPAAWPAAPGTWTRGAWEPAGSLPAADAGPAAAPYVVLVSDRGNAQVQDVFTGRLIATVWPDGQRVAAVAAAGDDRTFVLAGRKAGSVAFYELRLGPDGQAEYARQLFAIPATAVPSFALSPDASMLAYSTASGFETVSLATGTGRWWAAGGGLAYSMSWAGDRTLAFEWAPGSRVVGAALPAGIGIRLLDVTAPGPLLQASRLIIPYCLSGQVCAEGPQITPDGSKVLATRVVLGQEITTNVEEYSARTGQPLTAVTSAVSSPSGGQVCGPLWTDPSGAHVTAYCGRAEEYDNGHFGPVSLHLQASLLTAPRQVLAW
jgi:hypothetical protein